MRCLFLLLLVGCSAGARRADGGEEEPRSWGNGENERPLTPPRTPDNVSTDGGAFDLGGRASDGGAMDPSRDEDAQADAGPKLCGAVGPGDFKIVEIMIASQSGSGDKGEWVEFQSTRSCTLNAKGLTVSSPRGSSVPDQVTLAQDALIPPYGTFLVANTTSPQLNHGLPGKVFAFSGEPADVLRNDGDTITIANGQVTVDTVTYPKFVNLVVGSSVSFPWDCAWNDRSSWSRWSYSFKSYGGAYKGTPNADNFDVACY